MICSGTMRLTFIPEPTCGFSSLNGTICSGKMRLLLTFIPEPTYGFSSLNNMICSGTMRLFSFQNQHMVSVHWMIWFVPEQWDSRIIFSNKHVVSVHWMVWFVQNNETPYIPEQACSFSSLYGMICSGTMILHSGTSMWFQFIKW